MKLETVLGGFARSLALLLALTLAVCTPLSERGAFPTPHASRSGTIVLTRDETIAVTANRGTGVISVLKLAPTRAPSQVVTTSSTEIFTGTESKPWSIAIGLDDDTAYVVLRGSRKIVRVRHLHGIPNIDAQQTVGSEPTAVAITPSGARMFVANWGDGTLTLLTTRDFRVRNTLDLNVLLTGSGALGDLAPRVALAHPRALAITDDGDNDDDDETLYASEFFSQPLPHPQVTAPDQGRQGIIYRIPVSLEVENGHLGGVITLAPVAETGFKDATGAETACFPNQLYAAATVGDSLFVTGMCASPEGPVGPLPAPKAEADNTDDYAERREANFKTLVQPTVFVVDTGRQVEDPSRRVLLNEQLERHYATDGADQTARRMALIPNDLAISEPTASGRRRIWITALGADAAFSLELDATGRPLQLGVPQARFVDLHGAASVPDGRLPIGIALSKSAKIPFALVLNEFTRNISVLDLSTERGEVTAARSVAAETSVPNAASETPQVANGRRLFATGLGPWSYRGQAWNSCEGCHPDGLSDGVVWSFPRGPRRTLSLAGTYSDQAPEQQRLLLWGANADEIHDVEGIVRSVDGGVGGVLWQAYAGSNPTPDCRLYYDSKQPSPSGAGSELCPGPKHTSSLNDGLNGSLAEIIDGRGCDANVECDAGACINATCNSSSSTSWNDIDAFIRSIHAPRAPATLSDTDVQAGRELFRAGGCGACHSGPGFTLSRRFYEPGADQNGVLVYPLPTEIPPLGKLRETQYSVSDPQLRKLNPPAASGQASLRSWEPQTKANGESGALDCAYQQNLACPDDRINCALRDVGTFPTSPTDSLGKVVAGAPPVQESRMNYDLKTAAWVTTPAFGRNGYNIPSLLGLATGAPYFHAGNARSLEDLFDPTFSAHYQAVAPQFLKDSPERSEQVRQLVAYLLTIDGQTVTEELPPGPDGEPLFYDLCAAYE